MLIRKFVGRRLAQYYSQPRSSVVGKIDPSSVQLSSLWGEWHWLRLYQRLYEQQEGQWLTPVELFRPYYSQIIAEFIVRHNSAPVLQGNDGIEIVELGGGHGTNASLLLDYFQQSAREVYDRIVSYTIIDSSPTLLEAQKELLSAQHGDKVLLVHKDLTKVAEGQVTILPERATTSSLCRTVVMALEVFDNLPHDKIRVHSGAVQEGHICKQRGNNGIIEDIMEFQLDDDNDDSTSLDLEEIFVPLTDPLLKSVLHSMGATYFSRQRARCTWVPTVGLGVLRQLLHERPDVQLVLADFDSLPPPDRLSDRVRKSLLADGEPIITSMDDRDHACYLTAPRFCDILFPTNFRDLAHFATKACTRPTSQVTAMKQAEFLQTYGPHIIPKTKSWLTGYTPLLQDFQNYSIMTITHQTNRC